MMNLNHVIISDVITVVFVGDSVGVVIVLASAAAASVLILLFFFDNV